MLQTKRSLRFASGSASFTKEPAENNSLLTEYVDMERYGLLADEWDGLEAVLDR